jgi:hypothetical protein
MGAVYHLRYRNPGHPAHGMLVAKKKRGAYYLSFTTEPTEARIVRHATLYEWNKAFIVPELIAHSPQTPPQGGAGK